MSRPATDRLKVNPPLGIMPVLQFALPSQLSSDPAYQRSIDNSPSQTLIRRIAQHWDWSLCLPLVVSRRPGSSELFVIDGQHRLAAARLRSDIAQLPCVVLDMADKADEAAAFVHLNQQRRALSKLDIFKAAVASGDSESTAIVAALTEAGLSVAPHSNPTAWKPGQVSNIGGIEAAWRQHGATRTRAALVVMARGLEGQVLQYAGTIFPGVAALVVSLTVKRDPLIWMHGDEADMVAEMIGETTQVEWRRLVAVARGNDPALRFGQASAKVIGDAWAELIAALAGDDEDDDDKAAFERAGVTA
ncbi:DUF6551 family protein [Sphingopyxis sp. J-6]|uniref:DUF6551 family protein n=1 Tax=Sphingopyxis sp. J-6 TaxID=3122054 RepID=UPI003983DEB7